MSLDPYFLSPCVCERVLKLYHLMTATAKDAGINQESLCFVAVSIGRRLAIERPALMSNECSFVTFRSDAFLRSRR